MGLLGAAPKMNKGSETRASKTLGRLVQSYSNYRKVRWLRTGIASLDLVVGGGLPLGRFVELMGNPSTCKTVLALLICQAAISQGGGAAYLDPEAKVDADFAVRIGVEWEKLVYRVPSTLQDTFNRILTSAQKLRKIYPKGPVVVALDSIASTALDKEMEAIEKKSEVKISGEVGGKARAVAIGFPALLQELWRLDVLLLGVNHLKVHMGAFFNSYLETPGGRAIWYHASARILMKQQEKLLNDLGAVVGIGVSIEVIKNAVSSPFRKAEKVPFYFDSGFDPWKGSVKVLSKAGRIKASKTPGWYVYKGKKFRERQIETVVAKFPELMDPIR